MNVAQVYIRNAPLTFTTPTGIDLALLAGDWVRQFILSPPFAWRWNRSVTTFATVAGTQDYVKALSNFGWLEKASITNAGVVQELEIKLNLAEDAVQNQPVFIS